MTSPDGDAVVRTAKTYLIDLAERAVASAVIGFYTAFIPAQATNASMWYAALGAGLGAAGSVLKGALARAIGDRNSASLSKAV